jgi:hypothetical protein
MQITLLRKEKSSLSTVGELFVDGKFECYTLEDVVRDLSKPHGKVPGQTAIPAGTYKVALTMSNRFKKVLPLLLDVPHFEGIRIHSGNTAADTEGCILVGTSKLGRLDRPADMIGNSRVAFDALFNKMQAAKNGITITVKDIT